MKDDVKNKTIIIAIDALAKIANPIKWLQIDAENQGAKLNGSVAVQLSKDPEYLRSIAETALNEINNL